MRLDLNGIRVTCIIGDLPEERLVPRDVTVDLSLEIDDRAAATDDLADTVDYARLTETVRATLAGAKCRLIERAAALVGAACLSETAVRAARVRVTKAETVPFLASATAQWSSEGSKSGRKLV